MESQILARHEYYASSVVQPDSIDYQTAYNYFTKCGGVCSFLGSDGELLEEFAKDEDDKEETEERGGKEDPPRSHIRSRQLKKSSSSSSSKSDDTKSSSSAPNIVFVLVDDWGWNDVGWRSTYLSWTTPNIDKLASEGVKLDNYYTAYVCLPARSSLMTGRYPFRQGTWSNNYESELPLDESTLAQELQAVGYKTYMVGKWHLGFTSEDKKPLARGFDEYYGFLTGKVDYWEKTFNSKYLDLQDGNSLVTNAAEVSSDYHNSYLLQDKAEYFIEKHAKEYGSAKPMFLYYSMQMIHSNLAAPEIYLNRCHKPKDIDDDYYYNLEQNYCAMNVMVDEAVANLTCTLNNNGFSDNTYLIVVSDNGGDKSGAGSSYPFKGQKGSGWNGGVKATAFVHSKLLSTSVRGSTYTGMVHVTDWLPTLMHAATGGSWGGKAISGLALDGVDNFAAVTEGAASARSEIVHYHDGTSSVIQYGDYKLFTMDDSIECGCRVASPAYVFAEDEDPQTASLSCSSPSLMTSSKDFASSLLIAMGGSMTTASDGILNYFFDFVYTVAVVMLSVAVLAAAGLMLGMATDKMMIRARRGPALVTRRVTMDDDVMRKELTRSQDEAAAPHERTKLLP